MAKNVQFQSNSKKNEKDTYVKGSNGIYVFQFQNGSSVDLDAQFKDYIQYKLTGKTNYNSNTRNIGEVSWGFFKKPDEMSYSDFVKEVDAGNMPMIGYTTCIPTGRDYTRVDSNGNILVASINSKLENRPDTGNFLICGETGEVIRKPQPSTVIHSANKYGYYPVEIYSNEIDQVNGNKMISSRSYNFLDADGHMLCSTQNFNRVGSKDDEQIYFIDRNFYDRNGGFINDWDIYPQAIICESTHGVDMYPSALHALLNYNEKMQRGEELPNISYQLLEQKAKERMKELDTVTERIGMKYDEHKISDAQYSKIMSILDKEYSLIDQIQELTGEQEQ